MHIAGLVSWIRFSLIHDVFGQLHVIYSMYEILGGNYHMKYYKKEVISIFASCVLLEDGQTGRNMQHSELNL
jgi:hypothetical protein